MFPSQYSLSKPYVILDYEYPLVVEGCLLIFVAKNVAIDTATIFARDGNVWMDQIHIIKNHCGSFSQEYDVVAESLSRTNHFTSGDNCIRNGTPQQL
ncbi:hypothetical protein NPIL_478141 [Nephila pilipes]|uniref:Uncharacterized protein n=1 Tax=Nephila pilipes TaxID=299642 RepID=A0A8X6PTZ5_NEPPI|nr:hypothetical protein NPIL_478141 [Nephila pilipes]